MGRPSISGKRETNQKDSTSKTKAKKSETQKQKLSGIKKQRKTNITKDSKLSAARYKSYQIYLVLHF